MMMWGWDGMAAGGWMLMTLLWVAVIVLAVWAIAALFPRARGSAPQETPQQTLDRRYARGEIDADTYQAMRDELSTSTRAGAVTTPSQSRSWLRASLAVVALLALLAVTWTAGGPSSAGRWSGAHPTADDMPMGHMYQRAGDDGHEEQSPDPVDDAPEVEIRATEMAFTPDELTLGAGEPVNVTVTNDGNMFHDFDLDEADVHLNVNPGEQAEAALVIDEPGSYEAICTVPGHASAGMVLTIEVTQP